MRVLFRVGTAALAVAVTSLHVGASLDEQQTPEPVLVRGHGRAVTSLRLPGETMILTISGKSGHPFQVIPFGKDFVLTDVMVIAQASIKEPITVNISTLDHLRPQDPPRLLTQRRLQPGGSNDLQLCSGFVVPEGHSLVAYTNASAAPDQFASITVTGRLRDR
jgi:hypothetical protein